MGFHSINLLTGSLLICNKATPPCRVYCLRQEGTLQGGSCPGWAGRDGQHGMDLCPPRPTLRINTMRLALKDKWMTSQLKFRVCLVSQGNKLTCGLTTAQLDFIETALQETQVRQGNFSFCMLQKKRDFSWLK